MVTNFILIPLDLSVFFQKPKAFWITLSHILDVLRFLEVPIALKEFTLKSSSHTLTNGKSHRLRLVLHGSFITGYTYFPSILSQETLHSDNEKIVCHIDDFLYDHGSYHVEKT